MRTRRTHPLWQLIAWRLRAFAREPDLLVWAFVVPLGVTLLLGAAFETEAGSELQVTVVLPEGVATAPEVAALDEARGLQVSVASREEGQHRLSTGKSALVLVLGDPLELLLDPTQPSSETARLLTVEALARARGKAPALDYRRTEISTPGRRYVDFLLPGLLGFGLLMNGLSVITFPLVMMRNGRMLKGLAATPMRRSHLLLSLALSRLLLVLLEVGVLLGVGYLVFGVQVRGSFAALVLFSLISALAMSGLALLLGSRARTAEAAAGLTNLVSFPLMLVSGVFFSANHFPVWAQALIEYLPLSPILSGLRAVMNEGAGLFELGRPLLILILWGAVSFFAALRAFRWQ